MDQRPVRKGSPDRAFVAHLVSILSEKSNPAFLAANYPPPKGGRLNVPWLKDLSEAVLYLQGKSRLEVSCFLQQEVWPYLLRKKIMTGDLVLNNAWFLARHQLDLSVASLERLVRCRHTANLATERFLNGNDPDLEPILETIFSYCSLYWQNKLMGFDSQAGGPTLADYRHWINEENSKSNDIFLSHFLARNQYLLSDLPIRCEADDSLEGTELLVFGFGPAIRRLLALFDPLSKREIIPRLPRMQFLVMGEDFLVASCGPSGEMPTTMVHLAMAEWPWKNTVCVRIPVSGMPSVSGDPPQAKEPELRTFSNPFPLQRVASLIRTRALASESSP